MAKLNYTSNFVVKSDVPGNCIITNTSSPMDRPENIRYGYQEVQDVYKGSGIDPAYYGNSRKGVSVVAQITEVQRVVDSEDASYIVDLPMAMHLVIKVPAHQLITPAVVYTMLGRLMAALHNEAGDDSTKLTALLRGALNPPEI